MTTEPALFDAGPPGISRPIRRLARTLGPLALPLAGRRRMPLYAVLRHTGRRSGARYATPVVAFHTADGFLIPLPFGDRTQWARNLFAAGGGGLRKGGHDHDIGAPRIVDRGTVAPLLPVGVRFLSDLVGLRQFVLVRNLPDRSSSSTSKRR
jgi:deazaflavin-dependent oxidoreductase (nitroreductase family)